MIRNSHIVLIGFLASCSESSVPTSSPAATPIPQVAPGGVCVVPSHVPDDPYWAVWKVVAEDLDHVWFVEYTNRFPDTSKYLRPPAYSSLTNLGFRGTTVDDVGARGEYSPSFVRHPGMRYLGQHPITSQESNAVYVSMNSYRESFDAVRGSTVRSIKRP